MSEAKATVLIVDDEESIRDVLSRKLEVDDYNVVTASDGKEALWESFMQDFDLVLLDINMPGMSGMEVLSQVVTDHPDTSVVMITAVNDTQTAVEAMKLGAYDYLNKPFDMSTLTMRIQKALERRRLILENREYQLRLEQKVERQVGQIQQYYREAIQSLAREEIALNTLDTQQKEIRPKPDSDEPYLQMAKVLAQMAESHEPYAHGHSERVNLLAGDIAIQLGCSNKQIREVRLAAILHDVGKIVVPDHILFKPGDLTPAEYNEIKRHPTATVDMIRQLDYFSSILPIIESHHEWYNGKGYPNKLAGKEIPLGGRILAVADAYDAMTCHRPYRPRLSNEEAIEVLKKCSGNQWDPAVVDRFLRKLERDARMLQTPLAET